jgi:hypothetical protein
MNLSRENSFLLTCIQSESPDDLLNKLKGISLYQINWEEVISSAFWQKVAPLLFSKLQKIERELNIPQAILDKLKGSYYSTVARNTYLYAELEFISEAFRKRGIEVIALKGIALAKTVYEDIGLRSMEDIDLLVKKEDLPRAVKIMSESGYGIYSGNSLEWYLNNHCQIPFVHGEKNITVEIHWHVTAKYYPAQIRNVDDRVLESWWKKARKVKLGNSTVFVFSAEDTLLYLSIHFLKHRFRSGNGAFTSMGALMQLTDIYQTIKFYKNNINWKALKDKHDAYRLLDFTLCLLGKIVESDNDVFTHIKREYREGSINNDLVRLMQKRIFFREDTRPVVPGNVIHTIRKKKITDKISGFFSEIFPPPAVMSNTYSVPVSSLRLYLYYLIRPFILPVKYRKMVWETNRMKEDLILNKWINSHGSLTRADDSVNSL